MPAVRPREPAPRRSCERPAPDGPTRGEQVRAGAVRLVERYDQGDGGAIVVEPEYLQVVARKRG